MWVLSCMEGYENKEEEKRETLPYRDEEEGCCDLYLQKRELRPCVQCHLGKEGRSNLKGRYH